MKRSMRSAAAFSSVLALGLGSPGWAGELQIDAAILVVHESVEVAAPQSGVLERVSVREGARLVASEPIAEINAREPVLEAERIRAELSAARLEAQSDVRVRLARKEHRVAGAELGRAESVNAELPNTVSAKEIDRLRLAVERTELEIEHAQFERRMLTERLGRIEADLRLAEHRVERRRLMAPIAGVVAEAPKRTGEWVDAGDTIARIVRVDRLRAEGFVQVSDALTGLVGRSVTVVARPPGGSPVKATGRLVFVSPEAEPVDSKVRFWAEVDNTSLRLRPGLAVSVTIHDRRAPSVASVEE